MRNQRAGLLTENIYAGDGWFWWGWAERIVPIGDVARAAEIVTRVLRALDAPGDQPHGKAGPSTWRWRPAANQLPWRPIDVTN